MASVLAIGAFGISAAPASADHHLLKFREVFPGSTAAATNAEFVELQMYAPAQTNFPADSALNYYTAGGALGASFTSWSPLTLANGDNQRTFLFASVAASTFFGITPDVSIPGMDLMDPSGGALCFDSPTFGLVDCVSWGSFTTFTTAPTGCAGTPPACTGPAAPAIPDGSSLQRSIAAGCATLLDEADDTNSSSTELGTLASPTPRANAVAPTETACPVTPPAPTPAASDTTPPDTTITGGPKKKEKKGKATFSFSSTEPGSTFECKLDNGAFQGCTSPRDVQVKKGKHTFAVRAIDAAGNVDASPATQDWTVKKKKKKKQRPPPGGSR